MLPILPGHRVIVTSAGRGDSLRALRDVHGPEVVVTANEQDPRFRESLGILAAEYFTLSAVRVGRLESLVDRQGGFDWVLGAPPQRRAEALVRHGLFLAKRGGHVAYLLPLAFRVGSARRELFARHRPRFVWVLEEPVGGVEMAVFCWQSTSSPHRESLDSFSWMDEQRLHEDRRRILRLDWRVRSDD